MFEFRCCHGLNHSEPIRLRSVKPHYSTTYFLLDSCQTQSTNIYRFKLFQQIYGIINIYRPNCYFYTVRD